MIKLCRSVNVGYFHLFISCLLIYYANEVLIQKNELLVDELLIFSSLLL